MKKLFAVFSVVLVVFMLMLGVAPAATDTNLSGDMAYGVVTGTTGTAINVSIGWTPKSVIVTKVTNTLVQAQWQTGMAAASCFKYLDSATAASIITLPTVSCISTYAGSTSAAKGFTLGTDTDINVTGDTIRWQAYR
jgi:hypothetical protein